MLSVNRLVAAAASIVLLLAVALSVHAALRDRAPGDLAVARAVQDWPQPVGTSSEAIRVLTSTEVVVAAGLVLAAALVAVRLRGLALAWALLFVALPLVQSGVKALVDRPRPPADLVEVRGSATSPSFPSGHVMSGTVLLFAIALLAWQVPALRLLRWPLAAVCAALTAVNGIANVYEGTHWPSDVLGGYLWAGVLLVPFAATARRRQKATQK
jgi:membrane-associated phospholipid phosphatase